MFDPRLCQGCPIQGRYTPVEPIGNPQARFLVVTEKPTPAAGRENRLMTQTQMGVFSAEASRLGFVRSDFLFVPMCNCPYEPEAHHNKEKKEIHKHCRQHLLSEAESGAAEVVIPLGADAATQVFGKGTKITKVRGLGQMSEELGKPVFPLLSPGLVVRYPQNAPLFRADMDSLGRYVDAGYDADSASAMEDTSVEYRIVDDLQFLIDANPEIISFDTENTGLRWYQGGCDVRTYRPNLHKGSSVFKPRFQILTMQFCIEPGKSYMLVWDHPERPIPEERKPILRNQIRKLLCHPDRIVVGQNNKYDNVALWATEGIRYRIGGCTQMIAALLDENQLEKNLDVLTKIHVPEMAGYADRFNATVDKERMWEVPLDTLATYGCGDSDATLRVYNKLEPELMSDEKLWAHYCRISIPGLNAFSSLEMRGMFVDQDGALSEFKSLMVREVEEKRVALLADVDREVKRDAITEYCSKPANRGADAATKAVSFTRAGFLKSVLFTHRKGFRLKPKVFTGSTKNLRDASLREPSVSAKDHLPFFFDECPFTERLADYVKDESLLTKNVVGFEKKYIVGGKVRPKYHLHKAVTGRTASEDPNGQNYPKRGARAKAYRKMFIPPPGYYVCENDLSQAELRIAAAMANERTMLSVYAQEGDIHESTALIVAGITKEQFDALPKTDWTDDRGVLRDGRKTLRQKAKAVNFGFLYGMGWRKFISYAKTQYNAVFSDDEAQRVRQRFFRKYSGLESWHARMRAFANKHKYVRSFSGRVRHLPMIESSEDWVRMEAERQAINSPVQEFGSSLGVMALGRMDEDLDPEYIQIVGFVHDAIVYYVKQEYVEWGMKTVKRYMETNPLKEAFGVELPVRIRSDVGFGLNLGEIVEVADYGEFSLDKPFDFSCIKDSEGKALIHVPRQKIPPNSGRRKGCAFTTHEDLESEDTQVKPLVKRRVVHGKVSDASLLRMHRSQKQMVINRRNKDKRAEEDRQLRQGGCVVVRRRTAGVK